MNNLTNKIQAALLNYYTFERGADLVCTEVYTTLNSIGDVVVIKDKVVTEIEIKISLGDLQNELKKGREIYKWTDTIDGIPVYGKSKRINTGFTIKHSLMNNNIYTSPNKYYFCVPKYMLNETIEFANKLNKKYGVLCFNEDFKNISRCISVEKKAYSLHTEDNTKEYNKRMIDRLCNDLTKKYRLMYWRKNDI